LNGLPRAEEVELHSVPGIREREAGTSQINDDRVIRAALASVAKIALAVATPLTFAVVSALFIAIAL
jgi:hypothetical protein